MSAGGFSHLACPNPGCPAYGRRGAGNLCLHGWSGRGYRIRCLRCTTCGTAFSERANTPLFDLLRAYRGALPELIATEEYAVYEAVILDTGGAWRKELRLSEPAGQADGG